MFSFGTSLGSVRVSVTHALTCRCLYGRAKAFQHEHVFGGSVKNLHDALEQITPNVHFSRTPQCCRITRGRITRTYFSSRNIRNDLVAFNLWITWMFLSLVCGRGGIVRFNSTRNPRKQDESRGTSGLKTLTGSSRRTIIAFTRIYSTHSKLLNAAWTCWSRT